MSRRKPITSRQVVEQSEFFGGASRVVQGQLRAQHGVLQRSATAAAGRPGGDASRVVVLGEDDTLEPHLLRVPLHRSVKAGGVGHVEFPPQRIAHCALIFTPIYVANLGSMKAVARIGNSAWPASLRSGSLDKYALAMLTSNFKS